MIKSMGKANLHGLMANLITDNDSMANSMELESIPTRNQKNRKGEWAQGKRIRWLNPSDSKSVSSVAHDTLSQY